MTGRTTSHEPPYPDGVDPRPWWFRDFEARLDRRLESIERMLDAHESDRQQRRGVVLTGRTVALVITTLAAFGSVIGVAVALLAGGPS